MLNMLVDLGFSGSIVALVGERIHDRENVGRYLGAALSLRTRMLLTVGPLSALAFFWLAHRHHWPLWTSLPLFLSILASLFFQGWTACYTPPLLMHHQLGPLYLPAVLLNTAKLALCSLLQACTLLSATAICGLNALAAMTRQSQISVGPSQRQVTRPDPGGGGWFWIVSPMLLSESAIALRCASDCALL